MISVGLGIATGALAPSAYRRSNRPGSIDVQHPYGDLLNRHGVRVLDAGTSGPATARGPSSEPQAASPALASAAPDIVLLQESWRADDGTTQAERLAATLGYDHWHAGTGSLAMDGVAAGGGHRLAVADPRHRPDGAHRPRRAAGLAG